MHRLRTLFIALLTVLVLAPSAWAENPVLAAGAGYKKMVNALATAYTATTGKSLDLIYGNMGKVTTLAAQSGRVDLVIGDKHYLTIKAKLPFAAKEDLGRGRLVLCFAKSSPYSKVADLDNPKVTRIALPDTSKAIYGKAAREFLTNTRRLPAIKPKLVEVGTVPQVFSYLNTDEVDMGFMNLTHALNVKDKLGGYIELDTKDYNPIVIMAGMLQDATHIEDALEFLNFIKTPDAQRIIRANGL